MPEKALYIELTPDEFLERLEKAPIAYLPLGTLEWHGPHLPLGTDGILPHDLYLRLAERVGGIVLPMLFVAPDNRYKMVDGKFYYGMDVWKSRYPKYEDQQLPGSAYFVPDDYYVGMLDHVLGLLARAGFKIVVAHGHGPACNVFARNIDRWSEELGLKSFICWPEELTAALGIPGDHAGTGETSLMMHLRPHLVHMENLPLDPDESPLALGPDDPRVDASAERGRMAMEVLTDNTARVLLQALEDLKTRS